MKILTHKKQRIMVSVLADIAESFVKCCVFIPTEVLNKECDTIMEGIADIANDIAGLQGMNIVSERIRDA